MDIRGIGASCVVALLVCAPMMAFGAVWIQFPQKHPQVILQACNTWIARGAHLSELGLVAPHDGFHV